MATSFEATKGVNWGTNVQLANTHNLLVSSKKARLDETN